MLIEITPARLYSFTSSWPAHGLHHVDRLTVETDEAGELVDLTAYRERDTEADERGDVVYLEDIDGPALAALVADAIAEDTDEPSTQWEHLGNVELAVPVDMADTYGPGPWDDCAAEYGPRLAALNPSVNWERLARELDEYGLDREWDAPTAWEYAAWIIAGDIHDRPDAE